MKNILFLFLLLASCAPQKRLHSLIKNNPELAKELSKEVIVKDTIVRIDTIFIQGAALEIPFNVDSLKKEYSEIYSDSLSLFKASVPTKIKTKVKIEVRDRYFVKTDTIQYTKEVILPAKVVENKNWMWAFIVSWFIILGLILLYWRK